MIFYLILNFQINIEHLLNLLINSYIRIVIIIYFSTYYSLLINDDKTFKSKFSYDSGTEMNQAFQDTFFNIYFNIYKRKLHLHGIFVVMFCRRCIQGFRLNCIDNILKIYIIIDHINL